MAAAEKSQWLVERARALGFDLCGVAPAEDWPELECLPEWLARGYAGEMRYLHDPRRQSPLRVLQGARSVIVCALNYNTALPCSVEARAAAAVDARPESEPRHSSFATRRFPVGWISRYAWGDDYHVVLGKKLEALIAEMRGAFPGPFEARAYVDTGPVHERIAAHRAGLGWLAKNTCLINEELGSWLFLGVIVTTLDLAPSLAPAEAPPPDLCGQCTLCLDACPTGALVEPYVLDARRCISYLTIELRGAIPAEFRAAMDWQVFGCDICQDVCPWNSRGTAGHEPAFHPRALDHSDTRNSQLETCHSVFAPPLEWLASLSDADFRQVFQGSAVKRAKWQGLVRNACVALGNALRREPRGAEAGPIVALLERLAASGDAVIREHARWALAQRGASR